MPRIHPVSLVLALLIGVLSNCTAQDESNDTTPAGIDAAQTTDVTLEYVLAGASGEALDENAATVGLNGVTYHATCMGPAWGPDSEWIDRDDGNLLVVGHFTDVPCMAEGPPSLELVTVAWHNVTEDNPETWSRMQIVEAIEMAFDENYRLDTISCTSDGPERVVALVDVETYEPADAWWVRETGFDEITAIENVECESVPLCCAHGR